MKSLSIFSLLLLVSLGCFAQQISKTDRRFLKKKEDSLNVFAVKILMDTRDYDRFKADSAFTKTLVRALKTTNSFYYPFDSLQTISTLYAPDSSFRIFTWQLIISDNFVRQHGAIQMRTADGSLKLLPLIDKSELIHDQSDTITSNRAWVGALYYKIIETKDKNNNDLPCYTLFGYDENNARSTKKILDVLTFDENGQPIFGAADYFHFEADSIVKDPMHRYIMEFKKDAGPTLTYDDDMGMIVLGHLISETNEPFKKWTLIPDGDYEGFKWEKNKWVHIDKIFHQVTADGQAPTPDPIKNGGDLLHDKLNPATTSDNKVETPPAQQGNNIPTDNP
jgi:hypothetical protein